MGYNEVMDDASESGMAKLTDHLVSQHTSSSKQTDLTGYLVVLDAVRFGVCGRDSI